MPQITITFEGPEDMPPERLHELLCLTIHEGDTKAQQELENVVSDMGVAKQITPAQFSEQVQKYLQCRIDDIKSAPATYGMGPLTDPPTPQNEEDVRNMANSCLINDLIDHPDDFVAELNMGVE